jgi:hypothetical protein
LEVICEESSQHNSLHCVWNSFATYNDRFEDSKAILLEELAEMLNTSSDCSAQSDVTLLYLKDDGTVNASRSVELDEPVVDNIEL